MASGQTLLIFTAQHNQPPASAYATYNVLNASPCLKFLTAVVNYAIFGSVLPRNYAGGGITVTLHWTGDATPSAHNVVWKADWERDNAAADQSADNFDTADAQSTTTAAPTTNQLTTTAITFTNGQIGGLLVGEAFRFRVQRVGTSGSDTFTGSANLFRVEMKET